MHKLQKAMIRNTEEERAEGFKTKIKEQKRLWLLRKLSRREQEEKNRTSRS